MPRYRVIHDNTTASRSHIIVVKYEYFRWIYIRPIAVKSVTNYTYIYIRILCGRTHFIANSYYSIYIYICVYLLLYISYPSHARASRSFTRLRRADGGILYRSTIYGDGDKETTTIIVKIIRKSYYL